MTTIGLIGAGRIGSQLARLAVARGYKVVISNSRGPETLSALVAELGPDARAATPVEAAQAGDIVVVTVPLKNYRTVPVEPLTGKIVIDTNNYYPQRDGHIPELDSESTTTSELLQAHLPASKVVKAFNHIYAAELTTHGQPAGTPNRRALVIAGNDDAAKATVTRLIDQFGFDTVACASTGNLANSVAAHAAEARLRSYVFIPADLESGKVIGTLVYEPTVVEVEGTYDEVNRLCAEIGDKYHWAFVNINLRPYYAEGSKTYGYEIAEQLGWRAPAHVVVPCAGGSLLTKIAKAFRELQDLGLIPEGRTAMHAAQAAGCGPIVTMIRNDTDVLRPVRPQTIAKSLAIGNPADGYYAYRAVKESGGHGEHATDEEIIEGMRLLARTEGIFTETAGGVTVAATRKLIESGRIPRDEPVVICITGNGLKTPDVLQDRLSRDVTIRPSLSAFDRALADLESKTVA